MTDAEAVVLVGAVLRAKASLLGSSEAAAAAVRASRKHWSREAVEVVTLAGEAFAEATAILSDALARLPPELRDRARASLLHVPDKELS